MYKSFPFNYLIFINIYCLLFFFFFLHLLRYKCVCVCVLYRLLSANTQQRKCTLVCLFVDECFIRHSLQYSDDQDDAAPIVKVSM